MTRDKFTKRMLPDQYGATRAGRWCWMTEHYMARFVGTEGRPV